MMIRTEEKRSRLGIFGGTFDPVHKGHISLALCACREFFLDTLLMMPSGISYMKSGRVLPAKDRAEMVRRAIEDSSRLPFADRITFDTREIKRGGYTYTCDTIRELDEEYGDGWEFYYIIGGDTVLNLRKWKDIEVTLKRCVILVADRGSGKPVLDEIESLERDYGAVIRFIESFEGMDISSTQIRKLFEDGDHEGRTRDFLTQGVREYILENGFYRTYDRGFIARVEDQIERKQKKSRFKHTLGVAHTAACLAMHYGENVERAYLAGILHDNAKHYDDDRMLEAAREYGISVGEFEERNPYILHGPVGAARAQKKFGIDDPQILRSIENHTVGRVGMSTLEEIIFIADFIEFGRDKAENLGEIRTLAFEDLNKCMLKIISDTVEYVKKSGMELDESVLAVLEYYESKCS